MESETNTPDILEIPRQQVEDFLKINTQIFVAKLIDNHHKALTAKRASRREQFPLLKFLWPEPSETKSLNHLVKAKNGRYWHYIEFQEERLESAIQLVRTSLNIQKKGDKIQIEAHAWQTLAQAVALCGLPEPEEGKEKPEAKESPWDAWKAEAENNPDNGKTGWWAVWGIRHNAFAQASSALEAIEICDKEGAVQSSWESPSAKFIGENPKILA